jgi:Flp pilus assembly protein TadD
MIANAVRLLALAGALCVPALAFADDYADITQLMKSGQTAQALARADKAIAAAPRDPRMRFLKGVLLADSGSSDAAIDVYTQLTQEYPELPEPYNNLGALYAGKGEFDKARIALENAIRVNPGYATAHENLGDVYARLAAQSYAKARQLDAQNSGAAAKLAAVRQVLEPAAKAR